MSRSSPERISADLVKETNAAILTLVEVGLADRYNFATVQRRPGEIAVSAPVPTDSSVIKNRPYPEIYHSQLKRDAFNILFLDGALVQIGYKFDDNQLLTHRLAYLPAPDLEPYQTDPAIYVQGVPYLEAVGHQVVAVPLRFDYDVRPGVATEQHPASHLTLGQYKHCRIPVSGPVTPVAFLEFIVHNFYSVSEAPRTSLSASSSTSFERNIADSSIALSHLVVPTGGVSYPGRSELPRIV